MKLNKPVYIIFFFVAAFCVGACSTLQPPDANGPRGAEDSYPFLFPADDARQNATTAAIGRLIQPVTAETSSAQPLTLTVHGLKPVVNQALFLPKLGTDAAMTEEQTRESLRRFIREWQDLIGADPAKLSLIERVDQPDGIKLATYEQKPFRYPIRGNFGRMQVRFTSDRRVVSLSSNCIPDADRIQTVLAAVTTKLKPEDAINQVMNTTLTFAGPAGTQQSLKPTNPNQVKVQELVTYIRPSKNNPEALEFHIAWEIELSASMLKKVYVDAVNGEVLVSD